MGRVLKKKTLVCASLPQAAEKPAPTGLKDTGLEKGILNGRWKPGRRCTFPVSLSGHLATECWLSLERDFMLRRDFPYTLAP